MNENDIIVLTSTESVPGVAKCFGILVPVISTLYLSTNPGGTFVPVISTLYLSTNPGRIRFYCTGSWGPHWKVPVHIGGSLYSGQSNVMTFSLSPVLNWRYNSKQGDRDFVSTIKLGYRENVYSSVWLTFRSPSLVTFRFPSLNSKQGDRDVVSTIKLGYRENVSVNIPVP